MLNHQEFFSSVHPFCFYYCPFLVWLFRASLLAQPRVWQHRTPKRKNSMHELSDLHRLGQTTDRKRQISNRVQQLAVPSQNN